MAIEKCRAMVVARDTAVLAWGVKTRVRLRDHSLTRTSMTRERANDRRVDAYCVRPLRPHKV